MPTKSDYPQDEVQACLSALLELFTYLKPYRDYIVLVGGWAPYFLTEGKTEDRHSGSLDIDIALDANRIPEREYQTILEILDQRGYVSVKDAKGKVVPARYEKTVRLADGRPYTVLVDFLAPEYGGTRRSHRHQKVQDLLARKAKGSDLVFAHYVEKEISGRLPNGAENREVIKVADTIACFVMKSITFGQRRAEKDAYDLYLICDALGAAEVIKQLRPLKTNKLIKKALEVLKDKFGDMNALGPTSVADFYEVGGDDRERIKRRVYELFQTIQKEV